MIRAPRLLSAKQVAEHLGLEPSHLARLRARGSGPAYVKLGARVAYSPADVVSWVMDQRGGPSRSPSGAAPSSPSDHDASAARVSRRFSRI